MSLSTFLYVGVFITATPRTHSKVIHTTACDCISGTVNHNHTAGPYCTQCGTKIVKIPGVKLEQYKYHEISDDDPEFVQVVEAFGRNVHDSATDWLFCVDGEDIDGDDDDILAEFYSNGSEQEMEQVKARYRSALILLEKYATDIEIKYGLIKTTS